VAGVASLLVDLARLIAFLDHRANFAIAHSQGHSVHGTVMRQGKNIDRFHRIRQNVFKFLCDLNPRDKATDLSLDAGMFERNKACGFAVFTDDL
jgi:hypothetical protein